MINIFNIKTQITIEIYSTTWLTVPAVGLSLIITIEILCIRLSQACMW